MTHPPPDDMSQQETCPLCDTPMLNAPGIGPFCPKKDCPVVDGAALYDRVTKKKIREIVVIDGTQTSSERAAYRKGMLRAAEIAREYPNTVDADAISWHVSCDIAAAIRFEAGEEKP